MKSKVVYISDYLDQDTIDSELYGKGVHDGLVEVLGDRLVKIKNHSTNIWCRDYMQVKSATGEYVQFKYFPSYMGTMEKYKGKYPDSKKLHDELELTCESSKVILDGGAIEVLGKKAIVSDRVFRDNIALKEEDVYNEIVNKLDLEQLIVVPQYPFDFTGHVDGMVRFIDEHRVVVNDLDEELRRAKEEYPQRKKILENWVYAFKYSLINAGLKLEYIPTSIPEKCPATSGEGIYINFLLLEDMIIMPSYKNPKEENEEKNVIEEEVSAKLSQLYHRPFKTVKATELAKQGGMINCVTWTK